MYVGPSFAMAAAIEPEAAGSTAEERRVPLTVERLFRDHGEAVYRIVARLLGPTAPRADVEDLTQQVFVAAYGSLSRFRGEAAPSTWLYGIASRTVLRYLRSWRRHRRMIEALESIAEPAVPQPDQVIGDREVLGRVWSCLLRIKPKKRLVYLLHEVEGLSGKEIAAALDVKEATVWSRLHHARRELDAMLEAMGVER